MRTLITTTVICTAFVGAQGGVSKEELKKLQGTWDLVSVIADGKQADSQTPSKWTFQENKIIYQGPGDDHDLITAIDPTKLPNTMEVKFVRKGNADTVGKAIYKIEDQRLTICVDTKGKAFPSSFESKDGSGHRLVTLQKAKK